MKKADTERYQKLVELGCIICLKFEGVYSPPEIHHPFGRTKDGNQKTYPLCYLHHNARVDCDDYTSRHPYKFRFEERYDTDENLLKETNQRLASSF